MRVQLNLSEFVLVERQGTQPTEKVAILVKKYGPNGTRLQRSTGVGPASRGTGVGQPGRRWRLRLWLGKAGSRERLRAATAAEDSRD